MAELITGTFIDEITYDIPASNWSQEQWKTDLDAMCSIGIDTLIFIRGGLGKKTIFPCKFLHALHREDFAGFILKEAAERKMKVYFGLYMSNINWNNGDAQTELKMNRPFIDEVFERYGDLPSFEGWYIPHETGSNILNISDIMSGLSQMCKEKAPDKKILISPCFESKVFSLDHFVTPAQHFEVWDEILTPARGNIDICAFQDGTAPLDEMEEYYAAVRKVCNRHDMQLWVNCETFERDVRQMYYPIPFTDLKEKLSIHRNYADKIITFEFSHFMSPQSIYPSGGNLYNRYVEHYIRPIGAC